VTRPACFTDDEWCLWLAPILTATGTVQPRRRNPCVDCPLAFADEMRAANRCNGIPGGTPGRPRKSENVVLLGHGGSHRKYPTEELRRAARRMTWRLSAARKRVARRDPVGAQ